MRHNWQWATLALLLLGFGCHSRPATVSVQGEVSYEGRAIDSGLIDFVPVDNTPGASASAVIKEGRYAVDPKWGLKPDGVYQVRITAFRKTGRKEPNRIERGGPPIDVKENYIPPIYNHQSTLKVRIADLSDVNKTDFRLGNAISGGS